MSDLNFESFNFEDLAAQSGGDPFGDKKSSSVDERFYKLTRDQEERGAAVIRFLPDADKRLIQKLYKINVNTEKNGEKRWFNDWSPQNIDKPDPFHDHWAKLWNSGDKTEARKFGRQTRYIANIYVVKDPSNPENEGKVFLLDMSQSLKDIVEDALQPSKADQALGKKPMQLFNPLKGNSFKLVSKKGANGFITYESSGAIETEDAIFASVEEAVEVIKTKCYKLSDFLDPQNYKTYEELKEKLDFVRFKEGSKTPDSKSEVVDVAEVAEIPGDSGAKVVTPPAPKSDIDSFLDSVM